MNEIEKPSEMLLGNGRKNMQNTAKVSLPLYNKIQQQAQAQHKAHPLQPPQTTQQRSSIFISDVGLQIFCELSEKIKITNYITKQGFLANIL